MSIIRSKILKILHHAIELLGITEGDFSKDPFLKPELEIPKHSQHGDYATNVALILARRLGRNPREIAEEIISAIHDPDNILAKVEIAGPGFINFFVAAHGWHQVLPFIYETGEKYGMQNIGKGKSVQVEFVSANPTGPLHVGHGRGAAVGDVLARILSICGYNVEREYYINDVGNQMDVLGRSLYIRYQQLFDDHLEFPEDHYKGTYLIALARELLTRYGDQYRGKPVDEVLPFFSHYAAERILAGIKRDLEAFGISFDVWFSEKKLHENKAILQIIEILKSRGYIYERDGALWFRSTAFGDEKDRVVVRANGATTYFAADLAYHKNKFDRNFDLLIDVWGADHHGYVARIKAGVDALGYSSSDLKVILVQLVNLLRAGKPVTMSTRAGEFVTLREVIDEVGKDAARFIFLTRRSDTPLDFDLEVAKMQNDDNPVYYVQYAHARLCSIFEVARERGVNTFWLVAPPLTRLNEPEEQRLIKLMDEYPEVLAGCVNSLEPHRITYYLHELVSQFHSYYNHHRILGNDPELTQARLFLAATLRIVIRNALTLLGVSAPEKM